MFYELNNINNCLIAILKELDNCVIAILYEL